MVQASESIPVGRYDAGLLVEPPRRKTELSGYGSSFGGHRAMTSGNRRVEVHRRLPSVVAEHHGPAAEYIELGVNTPVVEALGQAREGFLDLCPAEERTRSRPGEVLGIDEHPMTTDLGWSMFIREAPQRWQILGTPRLVELAFR